MCQGGQVGWHTGSSVLVFYRIEGTQHSSFGEATLFTSGSFCLNLVLNLKRSFIFLDGLSKKSNGTSESWEASKVKNLEPSVLGSRFLIRELRAELVVKKEKPLFWF
jgi:hypothetical protein